MSIVETSIIITDFNIGLLDETKRNHFSFIQCQLFVYVYHFLASVDLLTTVGNTCCEAKVYTQPSLITGELVLKNIEAHLKTKQEEISSVDGVV